MKKPSVRVFRLFPILLLTISTLLFCIGADSGKDEFSPIARLADKKKKVGRAFDQPDEALEYYRLKRAPFGQNEIPVEAYLKANEDIKQLPVYSTATNTFEPSQLGTWTELGPGNIGGRTRALVIDPFNPNVMYAGGVAGGIWKTTNGGASWAPKGDLLPNLAVCSMAMDSNNPSVLYAGTGEGFFNTDSVRGAGIFKSTNGGENWSDLSNTDRAAFYFVNDIVVSPSNSNRVYAATRRGVFRSTNAGATWTKVLDSPNLEGGCLDLAIRTDQTNDYILATCGTGVAQARILRNTNAGGGGVWSQVYTEASMGRTSLAIAPSNQNVIYALAASKFGDNPLLAVLRSTDGGANWASRVRDTDPVKLNRMLLTNPVFAFFSECFSQPSTFSASHFVHADQHVIAFHPQYNGTTNKIMFVGNDGGIFRTNDARAATATGPFAPCNINNGSVAWTSLNNNYGVTQFYHGLPYPDGRTYIGGTQDNGTIRGTDLSGINGWNMLLDGDGGYVAVNPTNTNILYAERQKRDIQKSSSGGSAWAPATNGITDPPDNFLFITPFIMDPNDPQRLWTGGVSLWRTTNGASNWTQASAQLTARVSAIAVAPTNPNIVIVGTGDGRIYRTESGLSTNSSTVWQSVKPRDGFVSWTAFDPANPNIAYATYSSFNSPNNDPHHVYKSTNKGASWTSIDPGIPDVPVHCIVVDPDDSSRLYIGTDVGVFVSLNGGVPG